MVRPCNLKLLAWLLAAVCGGCASTGGVPGPEAIDEALRTNSGHGIRPPETPPSQPPDVNVTDGLSTNEAVATALWNNPTFVVALADLGFARADVIEAGQLRNPILSLLFPWGPKQFEATLQLPIEAIWQRPPRVKAAKLDAEVVAARLTSHGLLVIAEARNAYVGASAAEARHALAREAADIWGRLRNVSEARLREGDISELEARAVRSEAAMAEAAVLGADGDRVASRVQLDAVLGIDLPEGTSLASIDSLTIAMDCQSLDVAMKDALASRPDVRAAELAIEAAGARVGLEKARIFNLTATLDANGEGKQGFELGPGLGLDIPLNGNSGARARAAAALNQAALRYQALKVSVRAEIRTAMARLNRARAVLKVWDEQVLGSLEVERQQAVKAYQEGETPLYTMLDTGRRLVMAQRSRLDARVELLNAAVAVDRSTGKRCAFGGDSK
jgi:cobalt-zinc-cadmium efflux system outer membrane protein